MVYCIYIYSQLTLVYLYGKGFIHTVVRKRVDRLSKKRKRKKPRLKKHVKYELLGLLFIFLAILGSGVAPINEGFIPGGLVFIFRFIFGMWYFVVSLAFLIIGLFLLIKRRLPNFYDKKFIGLYIFLLGLLLLTHIQLFERLAIENMSILKFTWQQIKQAETATLFGGGIIGGLLLACCYYLFSLIGTKIIAVFSMLIGIAFIANISLGDLFVKVGQFFQTLFNKSKASIHRKKSKKLPAKDKQKSTSGSEVVD